MIAPNFEAYVYPAQYLSVWQPGPVYCSKTLALVIYNILSQCSKFEAILCYLSFAPIACRELLPPQYARQICGQKLTSDYAGPHLPTTYEVVCYVRMIGGRWVVMSLYMDYIISSMAPDSSIYKNLFFLQAFFTILPPPVLLSPLNYLVTFNISSAKKDGT